MATKSVDKSLLKIQFQNEQNTPDWSGLIEVIVGY